MKKKVLVILVQNYSNQQNNVQNIVVYKIAPCLEECKVLAVAVCSVFNLRSGPIVAVLIHFSLMATAKSFPLPPECYLQSEAKIEPELRLPCFQWEDMGAAIIYCQEFFVKYIRTTPHIPQNMQQVSSFLTGSILHGIA